MLKEPKTARRLDLRGKVCPYPTVTASLTLREMADKAIRCIPNQTKCVNSEREMNMSNEHIKETMESLIGFLAEHPEHCTQTDSQAKAVMVDGLQCRVEGADGVTVVTDMPKAIGGGESAPTPGWLMRSALASCDATMIAISAAREGVSLTTLEVTVESDSDNRGLLGMAEGVPAGPQAVRVGVRIGAPDVDAAQLRKIVDWAVAHSPVGDTIKRPVPVTVEVENG